MFKEKQLIIDIKKSQQLILLLCAVHVLAALSLSLIPLGVLAKLLLVVAIAISLSYYVQKSGLFSRIIATPGGDWVIQTRSGAVLNARVRANAFIGDHFMVLAFDVPEMKYPVFICLIHDAIDESMFSQLKLLMKVLGKSKNTNQYSL